VGLIVYDNLSNMSTKVFELIEKNGFNGNLIETSIIEELTDGLLYPREVGSAGIGMDS
jgi:hypothetical protein